MTMTETTRPHLSQDEEEAEHQAYLDERDHPRLESRLRRLAAKHGYRLHKSRQQPHINNQGEYMLVENDRNLCILGRDLEADLESEQWLTDDESEVAA